MSTPVELQRAHEQLRELRAAIEALCENGEPMVTAVEYQTGETVAAPVDCVAVSDLRALLDTAGGDGS